MRTLATSEKTVRNTIISFQSALVRLGVDPTQISISHSSTSFGNSSYLTVGPFKVRYSDHSVANNSRILNEIHISGANDANALNEIEYYFFPERFDKVEVLEFGSPIEVNENKIKSLLENGVEFEYTTEDYRLTNKGKKMYTIRVKNKSVTTITKRG